MLIFGLSSRDFLMATLVFLCERCHQQGAHQLLRRVRRISLFFVPLIPVGTRYLDVCTVCGRTADVPREQAERAAATGRV
ncbi:zinc ribbon domain-containing protein [Microlunatus flavus]|uniref:Zinc-ribbon family protein n=1 Tax=Microlunatus flavus TaxID=1036181 RepID=A0A1H9H1F9_9ACTN|nr:zinc-ribbon domain-containing protein [Microlunatus flavus]SEQ56077.1 zinc-ribbon family protein [Microlunatus flavus]